MRSSSGDIDIPIILLAMESNDVNIDNGTGKIRKMLDLIACKLSKKQRKAMLGLHSFSLSDYVSSFLSSKGGAIVLEIRSIFRSVYHS